MGIAVEVEEIIYTHEHLWRSSTELLKHAKSGDLSYKLLIPAVLMSFLAFEAFINFLGQTIAPDLWIDEKKNFKGKGLEGKLAVLAERLPSFQWDKCGALYKSIKNLERYRHIVSHGKVVSSNYLTLQKDDGSHFSFKHDWDEFLTIDAVNKAHDNVKLFSQNLLDAARIVSDDPHLIFNAYEGSLAHAMSSSKVI